MCREDQQLVDARFSRLLATVPAFLEGGLEPQRNVVVRMGGLRSRLGGAEFAASRQSCSRTRYDMGRNTIIRRDTYGDRSATGKGNSTFRIRSGFQPAHTANK